MVELTRPVNGPQLFGSVGAPLPRWFFSATPLYTSWIKRFPSPFFQNSEFQTWLLAIVTNVYHMKPVRSTNHLFKLKTPVGRTWLFEKPGQLIFQPGPGRLTELISRPVPARPARRPARLTHTCGECQRSCGIARYPCDSAAFLFNQLIAV